MAPEVRYQRHAKDYGPRIIWLLFLVVSAACVAAINGGL